MKRLFGGQFFAASALALASSVYAQSDFITGTGRSGAANSPAILSRSAPALAAATTLPAGYPPEARIALSGEMPLEHRQFLLHLYSRLGDVPMAEALTRRILAERPRDKQAQLSLLSMYVERKLNEPAVAFGEQLVQQYPTDTEALYFLGTAYYQAGQFAQAEAVLRTLKKTRFEQKLFPHEGDLASAALNAGHWPAATAAYRELLANPHLPDEVRAPARQVLETLYREHLPQVSIEALGSLVSSGDLLRTRVDYRQHLTDKTKIFVTASREDTHVKAALALRERHASNPDGVAGLVTAWSTNWTTAAWAGGNPASAQGGGSVERRFGSDARSLKLEAYYAERAADGLLSESLNARQNRLTLHAQYLLTRDWNFYAQAIGREVTIDRQKIGNGYGGTWNLERVLLHGAPDVRLGYRGSAFSFSRRTSDTSLVNPAASATATLADKTSLLNNLVLPHFHREGGYLAGSDRLTSALSYHFMGGADYAFERNAFEYYGTGGLSWYPIRRLELRTDVGYFTSARTSDADSDQWQISVALHYWF